jgi:hypothetical protein
VGAVAGTEPAAEIAGFAYGYAAEMCADACFDVFRLEDWDIGGIMWCKGRVVPSMINHSGFLTRSESGWGSRSDSHFVSSASLISSWVRWRMKTGLPRHLMITWSKTAFVNCCVLVVGIGKGKGGGFTFLPSGMAARSISTLACARTSADAAMLTRKSVFVCQPLILL